MMSRSETHCVLVNDSYLILWYVDGFRNSSTVIANQQVGYMLRTKLSDADEGGVAAGSGALDSPYLSD
jgi:hypothetical protein